MEDHVDKSMGIVTRIVEDLTKIKQTVNVYLQHNKKRAKTEGTKCQTTTMIIIKADKSSK